MDVEAVKKALMTSFGRVENKRGGVASMSHCKPYNYDQSALLVINYQDKLQLGTLANKLDLPVFHANYRNDVNGRLVCY